MVGGGGRNGQTPFPKKTFLGCANTAVLLADASCPQTSVITYCFATDSYFVVSPPVATTCNRGYCTEGIPVCSTFLETSWKFRRVCLWAFLFERGRAAESVAATRVLNQRHRNKSVHPFHEHEQISISRLHSNRIDFRRVFRDGRASAHLRDKWICVCACVLPATLLLL